ncbi:MAG: hypothetical protein FK730_14160 [Asgard group archaeon]|nr:hypothetical protein [Asgard group archaeon]
MNIKISRKIIALSFLALLIPVLIIPANSETRDLFYVNDFTVSSSDVFVEDFTNKDYKDLSTTASGWGDGAITNARNFSASELDHYVLANPIVDLDIQGRKAYAAVYDEPLGIDSLTIFNINDPSSISKLGGNSDWTRTKAVEASGDYLFAGQFTMVGYSVVVFDISNPAAPTDPTGWGFLDGYVTDIETDGHLVYFTNYNASSGFSLKIIYAEDPENIDLITCDWGSNQVLGLDVQGTTVYAAAGTEGFYVLNTTDKYSPVELDHIPLPGNATDVIVDGNIAYIAAGPAGVFAVDVSDPTNIAVIGHFDSPDNAIDLVKQGNTLFVADGASGVQVLDVVDPNNPTYVTDILLPYTYCVDLYGGVLVVGAEDGLYTYQICAGDGITNIEDHVFGNIFDALEAWDVRVQDDIAIVAGGPDGLYTLNVRDPNNPILLDQDIIGVSPFYRKLDIRGDFAYVADFGNAFRVYDISDPTNIFQTDYISLSYPTDVAVSGDMAYVADGTFGVYIFNISDPYNVPLFNFFDDAMVNITSVWVQGNTLYAVDYGVGGYNPSFYIYDMSDIDVEVQLSAVNRWDTHYDVKIDGDVAYLSTEVWLTTYDITNPAIPTFGNDLEHDGGIIFSLGVWNFGPYVLSASGAQGVHLVDSTNIFSPGVDTQNYPDATGANQIITHGDYTYIANRSSLIILRHFESAADTYIAGAYFAKSLEVDSMVFGEIKNATLDAIDFAPPGIPIDYYMSADGGVHWEAVTPGVGHDFVFTGDDLRWRVEFVGPSYRSAHVFQIEINYEFNEAPTTPTLADLGDKAIGTFKVDWSDSTDDVSVDHYVLQMSDTLSFTTIVKEWTTTKSSKTVLLGKGTFYFRVQAVDNEDFTSQWSLIKQADTKLSSTIFGVILGGGLIVVILAIVIPLVLVRRKKKIPTR